MSVDIMQNCSSTPLKETGECQKLLQDGASKCAEIFVTNNADKWTLFCAYCQMTTNDIGVFICHIRLDHLSIPQVKTKSLQSGSRESNVNQTDISNITPIDVIAEKAQEQEYRSVSGVIKQELIMDNESEEITPICSNKETTDSVAALNQPGNNQLEQDNINKVKTKSLQPGSRESNVNQTDISNITPNDVIAEEAQEQEYRPVSGVIKQELIMDNESEEIPPICSNKETTDSVEALNQPGNNQLEQDNINKDSNDQINEEFFAITSVDQYSNQPDPKEIVQVIYMNDEAEEKTESDINSHKSNDISNDCIKANNPDCYTPSDGKKTTRAIRNRKTKNKPNFKAHEKKYIKQLLYKCNICQKKFVSKIGLKLHLKSQHQRPIFKCTVCPTKHSGNNFITHLLTHESESCFPCQVCGNIYPNDKERKKHWESHAEQRPFYCNICYRRYRKKQHLKIHLKTQNRYQCHLCATEYETSEVQQPPYICGKCATFSAKAPNPSGKNDVIIEIDSNSENNEYDTYNVHVSYQNNDNLLSDDENSFIEPIKDSYNDNVPSGSSSSQISQSLAASDKIYRFRNKCQYCNRGFVSIRGLYIHLSKIHDKNEQIMTPYICRYCQKTFQTRSGLAMHCKTHDKKNQFNCPICPLTEFRESSFITHVLQHENDFCFPCQVCAKILPTNQQRLEHWKIHLEERPHGCNLCFRRFYKRHVLKNHMKSHGLYCCHFCGVHFNSADTLHPPYICMNCKRLPDIKNKIELRKPLANNHRVFDSEEEE